MDIVKFKEEMNKTTVISSTNKKILQGIKKLCKTGFDPSPETED